MANTISTQAHIDPHKLQQHNNKNLARLAEKQTHKPERHTAPQDNISLNQPEETSATYSSSATVESGSGQDQFTLLRSLVTSMLKEQGIDFQVANGNQTIDISSISQEEAVELVAADGYFGVEQTSDRIVEFAIAAAGGDPSKLAAIKEGVENGFGEALEAFGGTLPDISYETFDAVMNKLDAWADVDNQ